MVSKKKRKKLDISAEFQVALSAHQNGDLNKAQKIYDKILAVKPDHADSLHLLGLIEHNRGKHKQAIALIERAISINSEVSFYWNNIGEAYRKLKRYDDALHAYKKALFLNPKYPVAQNNLGNVYFNKDELDQAIIEYRKAAELDHNFAEAYYNLGSALRLRGKYEDSITALKRAVELNPNYADAYNNLGLAYGEQGDLAEAVEMLKRAVSINNAHREAWGNLGSQLYMKRELGEAKKAIEKAIEVRPEHLNNFICMGSILQEEGDLDGAREVCMQVRDKPLDPDCHGNILFFLNYDYKSTAEEIFKEYRKWDQRHAKPLFPKTLGFENDADPEKRVRIGYVSADFGAHVVRYFISPLILNHDHGKFEIFCYANVKKSDEMTDKFKLVVDHWCDINGMKDEEVADKIRKDRIDILVDLSGHTNGHRLLVFARKPAPIQITWLGFGYTTGMSAVDYFIGDERFTPYGCEHLFSENIVRLKTPFVYMPPTTLPEVEPPPCTKNGYITFGSLSRIIRFNDKVINLWSNILKSVPNSKILLNNKPFEENIPKENFLRKFEACGISRDRVVVGFDQPHWTIYHQIDITLDPFPHNAGTTTFESLWMGVPVISKKDRPSVGCFGNSILGNIGLSELVAETEDEYLQLAVKLSKHQNRLTELRSSLRDMMRKSVLMDYTGFARQMEEAYRNMWQNWCNSKALTHINIEDIERSLSISNEEHPYIKSLITDKIKTDKLFSNDKDSLLTKAGDFFTNGDVEAAKELYEACIKLYPESFIAYAVLGIIWKRKGDTDKAIACYSKTLALNPNHADTHANLGRVYRELLRREEAAAAFRRAVALRPNWAMAQSMLSNVLREMDDFEQSLNHALEAVKCDPNYGEGYLNQGNALRKLERIAEAETAYRKCVEVDPNCFDGWSCLGSVLKEYGRLDEAIEMYEKAISLCPEKHMLWGNLFFCLNYHPYIDAVSIINRYREWGDRLVFKAKEYWQPYGNTKEPERILRIGYISADFCGHVVRHFIEPFFEYHDRNRFEIYIYANVEKEDINTEWFKQKVNVWRDIRIPEEPSQIAKIIRNDKIDILVDLSGHTGGNRLTVLAFRPAPVQFSYLGYGYTSGLTSVDYFLGDHLFTPDGCDELFAEKIIRLPRTPFCWRPPAAVPCNELPALTKGYITFGSLTRTVRLNRRVVALWSKILLAIPGSRLKLDNKPFKEEKVTAEFRELFKEYGIEPERLEFGCTKPYWNAYHEIDIALDPFPHNAGTTTLESLWMGVPVISMADRPSVGRFGATLLGAVGMSDWVAGSEAEYLQKAVIWSKQLDGLSQIRRMLREKIEESPIRDEKGFTNILESVFRETWRRWCVGLPVESFTFDCEKLLSYTHSSASSERAISTTTFEKREPVLEDVQSLLKIGADAGNMGELATAEEMFRKAAMLKPDNFDAWNNLAVVLNRLGRVNEAVQSVKKAITIRSDIPQAYSNLGTFLETCERLTEAADAFNVAISLNPDNINALNGLGCVLRKQGKLIQAERVLKQALSIKPDFINAISNLASTLREMGRFKESEYFLEKSISLVDGDKAVIGDGIRLFTLNYHPDKSAEEIFAQYNEWNIRRASEFSEEQGQWSVDREPEKILRVGFVSSDFKRHSIRFFLEPLLAYIDRKQFELIAYSQTQAQDEWTLRYKGYFAEWYETAGKTDSELAQQIRENRIDILIDIAGHTAGSRLLVFARKPAPVQVSWLGFGYTTGLCAIDYFIGDSFFTPLGCESIFSERIIRLPTSAFVYRAQSGTPEPGGLPLERNNFITLGTLSRSSRINNHVISLWSKILKALPDAKLIFNHRPFGDSETRGFFAAQFAKQGIGPHRLIMEHVIPHWNTYHKMDISLDPFPHNCGTTTFDSLWMGVPVVSLKSRPSVGRFGDTILSHLGHPEWVAETEDQYVSIVKDLSADIKNLANIRRSLRRELQSSPLMDETNFAKCFGAALRSMWYGFCEDRKASDSDVKELLAKWNSQNIYVKQDISDINHLTKEAVDAHKAGNFEKAEAIYRKLLEIPPVSYKTYANLGALLKQKEEYDEAIVWYEKALRVKPDYAVGYYNMGATFQAMGQMEKAVESYEKSIFFNPKQHLALNNLGVVLKEIGRYKEAEERFNEAILLKPDYVTAMSNLAQIYSIQGRQSEGEELARKVIVIDPVYAQAYILLGGFIQDKGDINGALECYKRAMNVKDDLVEAYLGAAMCLKLSGQIQSALTLSEKAIDIEPENASAWNVLGVIQQSMGLIIPARVSFEKALSLQPENSGAMTNLGSVLRDSTDFIDSLEAYKKTLAQEPGFIVAHSNMLFTLNYMPDISAQELFDAYKNWDMLHARPFLPEKPNYQNIIEPTKRIRIGYVSPDFREHVVRYFIEPVLANHDKQNFEIFVYTDLYKKDRHTERIRKYVDVWHDTLGVKDDELAEHIQKDCIDILIDLAGHTSNNRLMVFARKPSPIQVSWLGFGYTTGLSAIDYFIGDERFTPNGCENYFSEKILRLPNCAFCYLPDDKLSETVGKLPAIQNGFITFGSLSRTVRFNRKVLNLWSKILKALPNSRLMLNNKPFRDKQTCSLFTERFAELGIEKDRLILCYTKPLSAYNKIDIALDPFPHNAGTTTFEALWMGVPVISLKDRPSVGRFGASILGALDMNDWVLDTEEEYIDAAVRYGKNYTLLQEIRTTLRERMKNSVLCDGNRFTRDIEKTYREIWERWCISNKVENL